MSDQHNERAMGCTDNGYGGVTTSMTPTLDQLADTGIRFENAMCPTAQCCPTRYSYITGLWPHSHGVRWNGVWEPRNVVTLPQLARKAGYETATIGKNHFYWLEQQPVTEDLGFNLVTDVDEYAGFCFMSGQMLFYQFGNLWGMPNLPAGLMSTTGWTFSSNFFHPSGYWANQVIRFLEERAADEKPFLCYYSMIGPHTPVLPTGTPGPEDFAHRYHPYANLSLPPNLNKVSTTARLTREQNAYASVTDDQWRETLSYYYGLVTQIDYNIGRVLTRLDQLGLRDNTLVIYTADHGEMSAEMRTWQKGAGSYDAITKVPLIMSLPNVIPPNQVSAVMANTLDLVPTILDLTGIPISDADRAKLDGRSMTDVALGNVPTDWPTEVYNEFGTTRHNFVLRHRMVRTADYKYSYDELGGGQEEFYDMVNDEFEITNLIQSPDPTIQAAITSLRAKLASWWNNEQGHAPEYLTSGEGNARPAQLIEMVPANGLVGVPRNINPSWLLSTAADTMHVHFGTDPSNLPLLRKLGPAETSFNVGTLKPGKTYYWRVDQLNGNGRTDGNLMSFTTVTGGGAAPGMPSMPTPAHRTEGFGLNPFLTWSLGSGTRAQKLYFGPAGAMQFVANLPGDARRYAPGVLKADTTYEWRVDSYMPGGMTEGDVWEFTTTHTGLPRHTVAMYPLHMQSAATIQSGQPLAWYPSDNTIAYDVYFGQTFPLQFRGSRSVTHYYPGVLNPNETYYWRVDSKNRRGEKRGFTWRFTTAP